MPRAPGPINNEFLPVEFEGKSAMVICKHCQNHRVAKASNKRKEAHLRKCEAYLRNQAAITNGDIDAPAEPIFDVHATVKQTIIVAQPYWWPHDASLSPSTTALVLVDMQRDFCSPGGYMEHQGYDITPCRRIIPGLQRLLHACRAAHFQIYHTREGHRPDLSTLSTRERFRSKNNSTALGIGDVGPLGRLLVRGEAGHDTIPELYPIPGEPVIDKPGRGAFAHTDFQLLLRLKGIRNLILAGVTTDVCVTTTMREANDRGFDCLLVSDGSSASEEELHDSAVKMVMTEGGIFGATAKLADVLDAISSFPISAM